jgi:hypothetical protein
MLGKGNAFLREQGFGSRAIAAHLARIDGDVSQLANSVFVKLSYRAKQQSLAFVFQDHCKSQNIHV